MVRPQSITEAPGTPTTGPGTAHFAATLSHAFRALRPDRAPSCASCGQPTAPDTRHVGGRGHVSGHTCTNPVCGLFAEARRRRVGLYVPQADTRRVPPLVPDAPARFHFPHMAGAIDADLAACDPDDLALIPEEDREALLRGAWKAWRARTSDDPEALAVGMRAAGNVRFCCAIARLRAEARAEREGTPDA